MIFFIRGDERPPFPNRRIFFILIVNSYNNTNNLCKFKKNRIKQCGLYRVKEKTLTKILVQPFSHTVYRIFFIFHRINPYNDTNKCGNLSCKREKVNGLTHGRSGTTPYKLFWSLASTAKNERETSNYNKR